ncbi:MAG: methanogenesis marker 2 protein [Desulfobacca sp.]|nr:methanogenesis marker 2 protein [Desulfobacca sp.]
MSLESYFRIKPFDFTELINQNIFMDFSEQKEGALPSLITKVRNYPGLTRKQPIRDVFKRLVQDQTWGSQLPNYGDDAAVIPWGDGFLLLAADGIMPQLLINEPYAAGKAAVMVSVNDIYSMGGRPIAMVNVLAYGDPDRRAEVVEGIKKGCQKLQVPMVGGHLHPDAPSQAPALSVAILGSAKKVLRSHLAKAGDELILAVDLEGQRGCQSVVSWDANSGKSSEEILHRLEILPLIAERELAVAAKDISNAGILGTIAIMMENSGQGAVIDLPSIPRPAEIAFSDWLIAFQSFSFIFSVPIEHSSRVCSLFKERNIEAARIGKVTAGSEVIVKDGPVQDTLFDFSRDRITGISVSGFGCPTLSSKPPCPAFGGVAPPNMKIELG